MRKSRRTFAIAFMTALALVILHVQPLQALGPTVLMFYGEPLTKPVLVAGEDANAFPDRSLLGQTTVTAKDTAGRSFIKVALFWGLPGDPARNGTPLAQLTPQMAAQHGRFYPATATQPALLLTAQYMKQAQGDLPDERTVFNSGGPVAPAALAVLQRLGIPAGPARSGR